MEISYYGKGSITRNGFKIDLIVWKSGSVSSSFSRNQQFKIDLIVWK